MISTLVMDMTMALIMTVTVTRLLWVRGTNPSCMTSPGPCFFLWLL